MVADMEVDMVADMEVDMVADMEVDMVADMEVDMVVVMEVDMVADMVADEKEEKKGHAISRQKVQFGEIVGHGGWLIGPKLFRPEAYLICVSSKLSELIFQLTNFTPAPQVNNMSYDHKTEKKEIQ